ncbi:hypothetical protein HH308_28415 [Gordonia sp. TBRC 11910]|uniref:Uncharacterized protein n=1 Tax=Gordonia asplenii TaxID=2725283 RepID=A0A848L3N5_9ACTN|nr:hypothetical protein [Gordonia asplenii]NMO05147.1 hypothetical protein [Gordonia asplenii]
MSPQFQAVLLPVVVVIFLWRFGLWLFQSRDPVVGTVYVALAVFAVATYYGIQTADGVHYQFRVWLIWLEYLAIMLLVRALAEAFGVRVSGHLVTIAVISTGTAVFALATPPVWTGRFVDAPATLLILYLVSAGCYIPWCLSAVTVHILREPKPRGSMWVSAIAMVASTSALAVGFTLNAVEFGIYLSRNTLPELIEPLSRTLLDAGLVLLIIGTLTPALVSRGEHLRRTVELAGELRVMRRLAHDIVGAIPQLGPAPWPTLPWSPARIRLAHYRRYVLIRDGLTRLSPALPADGDIGSIANELSLLLHQPLSDGRDIATPVLAAPDDVGAIVALCAAYRAR